MGALIDGAPETVKHEIKKQEGAFIGALLARLGTSLVHPGIFSVAKVITGREVRRVGRVFMDDNF